MPWLHVECFSITKSSSPSVRIFHNNNNKVSLPSCEHSCVFHRFFVTDPWRSVIWVLIPPVPKSSFSIPIITMVYAIGRWGFRSWLSCTIKIPQSYFIRCVQCLLHTEFVELCTRRFSDIDKWLFLLRKRTSYPILHLYFMPVIVVKPIDIGFIKPRLPAKYEVVSSWTVVGRWPLT